MGRHAKEGLSHHPTKGYRISIGKTPDGRYRTFWLGHERATAEYFAYCLQGTFNGMQLMEGRSVWDEADIESIRHDVKRFRAHLDKLQAVYRGEREDLQRQMASLDRREQLFLYTFDLKPRPDCPPVEPLPPIRAQDVLTLEKAVETYQAILKARTPNQVSLSHYHRQCASLRALKASLERPAMKEHGFSPAMPVSQVGHDELMMIVAHFTGRPTSKHGKPMAADTITTTLKHIRAFFDWLDDGKRWDAPKRMAKVFTVRKAALLTPAEQRAKAKGQQTFTLPELKALYQHANRRQRLLMLLGLNCGFTQKDIATLAAAEIDLRAGVVDRIRHKTRAVAAVHGRWVLWEETKALLGQMMARSRSTQQTNPEGLALLSEDGHPLVHEDSDTDAVALSWARLLDGVNAEQQVVRRLSFKYLRKTASDAILKLSNESVQQTFLGHAQRTVAGRHYTGERDFAALTGPLQQWHSRLENAGLFERPQKQ